jgi:hypothetical protein
MTGAYWREILLSLRQTGALGTHFVTHLTHVNTVRLLEEW